MENHDEPPVPCDNSADIVQITWPASGLPTDIFTTILLVALSSLHFDPFETPALKRLYQLRLVSLAWHHIVDSAPVLWTFIESCESLPPDIIDIALERSETSLLSIKYRPSSHTKAPLFMGKVVPHIGRWRVVDLCNTALEHLPQAPAPRLRDLSLTIDLDIHSEPGVFRGEFTSLQSLTLNNVYPIGPLPNFGRNLRFLTIRQWPIKEPGITYTEIHRLLLLHSNLIEVEFEAPRRSQATPDFEILDDVSLPSLRRFSLSGLGSNSLACIRLLRKIAAPNCTSFELAINNPPEGYSGLLRTFEHYFTSVIAAVSRDLTLSLEFALGFTFAIGRGDKTFELRGSAQVPEPDAELGGVIDLLVRYRPNVTGLKLVTYWDLSDDGLLNLFMALPDVTQLRSEGRLEASLNALEKQAAVPGAERGAAEWLLPALEKLSVFGELDREGERFIAMIQAREAAATDMDSTRSLAGHHPVRWKKVEYQGTAPLADGPLSEFLGDRFMFEIYIT
ncbi:hypothetical protein FS837_009321 [Tulasnella sp. UAMH 9824]|nr:hypothetical protein FS837_009321 [Tulasnella sp. UAMH 9824]